MSVIGYSLNDIKFKVPRMILEAAFIRRNNVYNNSINYNLDDAITLQVIKPRVLMDCNLVGGTQALIPLEGLAYTKPDQYTTVIRIPKEKTQGRSINSVLNVSFYNQSLASLYSNVGAVGYGSYYNAQENSSAMQNAVAAMAAMDKIPVTSTASCQLIAENTVMIKNTVNVVSNGYLRCVLANDEELNHIQPKSYPSFSKLVEYAIKAYIYNTLIVEIDQGQLQGGQQLGIFKSIVEGYSDAEQNYQDYLREKWQAIAVENDHMAYNRLLKLTLGGNR